MRALIIGASSDRSIGYHIGEHRKSLGDDVAYASRSGALGYKCDVTDIGALQRLFERERPQVVVLAVGTALQNPSINSFDDWQRQCDDIMARSIGAHATLIAAWIIGTVTHFVALGGRAKFDDPNLETYTISNGALWGAVQHANAHGQVKTVYVDMPFVRGSANAETLARAGLHTGPELAHAIPVEKVVRAVDDIFADRIKPGRVML